MPKKNNTPKSKTLSNEQAKETLAALTGNIITPEKEGEKIDVHIKIKEHVQAISVIDDLEDCINIKRKVMDLTEECSRNTKNSLNQIPTLHLSHTKKDRNNSNNIELVFNVFNANLNKLDILLIENGDIELNFDPQEYSIITKSDKFGLESSRRIKYPIVDNSVHLTSYCNQYFGEDFVIVENNLPHSIIFRPACNTMPEEQPAVKLDHILPKPSKTVEASKRSDDVTKRPNPEDVKKLSNKVKLESLFTQYGNARAAYMRDLYTERTSACPAITKTENEYLELEKQFKALLKSL